MQARLVVMSSFLAAGFSFAHVHAETPPSDNLEAAPVEELVVRGRLPGPAWWRVSDADSTVFVMGMPEALPKGMRWDLSVLKRRLEGATGLITPPTIGLSIDLFSLPKLMFDARNVNRSKVEIDQRLPDDLVARLERASVAAGEKADAFTHVPPWIAGLRLTRQFHRHVGLSYREPLATMRGLAGRAGVAVTPADATRSKAASLLQDIKTIPDAVSRRCVESAVAEVETGDALVRAAAAAWAAGEVRVVLDRQRSSQLCLALLPGAAASRRDSVELQADAIEAALSKPGHSVAALPLSSLVTRGGVLDRLRQRGRQVRAPE